MVPAARPDLCWTTVDIAAAAVTWMLVVSAMAPASSTMPWEPVARALQMPAAFVAR